MSKLINMTLVNMWRFWQRALSGGVQDHLTRRLRGRHLAAALALFIVAVAFPAATLAAPAQEDCNERNLNSIKKLQVCVNADDVISHLQAFQDIADANGGTRASGTAGFDASADYVADLLEDAGFTVERQVFAFSVYTENSSSLTVDAAPIATQSKSKSFTNTAHCGLPTSRIMQFT